MIELITVMILVGILGAVGMGRFFQKSAYDADQFTDQAKTMLRYGQKVAIAQGRPVFVRLDRSSVALCFNAACSAGNRVVPPAGNNSGNGRTLASCDGASNWFCEGLPAGLSYGTTPTTASFYFDPAGKPFAVADVWPVLNSTFAGLKISLTGDGANHDIIVEAETGYVH